MGGRRRVISNVPMTNDKKKKSTVSLWFLPTLTDARKRMTAMLPARPSAPLSLFLSDLRVPNASGSRSGSNNRKPLAPRAP